MDLADVVFPLLRLQLLLLFVKELERILYFVLLVRLLNLYQTVLSASFFIFLFKLFLGNGHILFCCALLESQSLLIKQIAGHGLLPLLSHPVDLLILRLFELE